ncbi:hypothetical protein H257_19523 [Aphanomyces astaci]|uniref:Uncharacterized protein n=1 Tax=Aphanomyces astaci TaxID=112090 RepID=W4F9S0_APHAT|nr:hypothetical protein H257_19523 [Aphanomyces astaci]ETV63551.1 hypothetical protein H257_19523 [Aphanomyces astaci]|eukprot:XP_009846965.1 hypothetical protein H257_19523 [Aphanomyces astaci]
MDDDINVQLERHLRMPAITTRHEFMAAVNPLPSPALHRQLRMRVFDVKPAFRFNEPNTQYGTRVSLTDMAATEQTISRLRLLSQTEREAFIVRMMIFDIQFRANPAPSDVIPRLIVGELHL